MKILHVINSLDIGGAEKLLVELLPLLEQNDTVDLLLLKRGDTTFIASLLDKFKGQATILDTNLYNPLLILRLKKHLVNYDLVHVHLFPCLYWLGLTKFLFRIKAKFVFTEHSTNNRRIKYSAFRLVDKLVYSQYDLIIAITEQVKEVLLNKMKISDSKIVVINNGVDLNKYVVDNTSSDLKLNIPEESKILMQVSRFSEAKDQQCLIRSLTCLPKEYYAVFVGDGELKLECVNLATKLGVINRTIFLGNRIDIPMLLSDADIVIQSSNWEGFGLAAVEGMATGKPVIASNVPGLANIVKGYGLLFEKGDFKQLANTIRSLEDTVFYDGISLKCKMRSQDFSLIGTCVNLLDCYHKLVD